MSDEKVTIQVPVQIQMIAKMLGMKPEDMVKAVTDFSGVFQRIADNLTELNRVQQLLLRAENDRRHREGLEPIQSNVVPIRDGDNNAAGNAA